MACSGCGGKSNTRSMAAPLRPSLMKSSNTHFNFGPYGTKASRTIIGRVKPSGLKGRKR